MTSNPAKLDALRHCSSIRSRVRLACRIIVRKNTDSQRAGTYGCTRQACAFRDALTSDEVFKSTEVEVVGVSPDPVEKQKKFVEKEGLTVCPPPQALLFVY